MKQRSAYYWTLGFVIAAIVIAISFYFDDFVREFIARHQDRTVRGFMENVSRFGDWPEHFALGLVLAGAAWWRGNRKWTCIFVAMLIALAIAGLAGRAIKISTGRVRPSVKTEHVWNGPRLRGSKYHSFPSGHVAASSAFFGVLLLARRRIGIACLTIPVLVGFARIYIGAHYLSDVVCAAVLGIVSAVLVWRFILPKIESRQSKIEN